MYFLMSIRLISGNTKRKYPTSYIGGKAQGLLKLKGLEKKLNKNFYNGILKGKIKVPNFFILPVGYDVQNKDMVYRNLDNLKTDKFAIRSSSPFEDSIEHGFDGVYDSFLNVNREEVIDAIESVKASALGQKAIQYSKDFQIPINKDMAIIAQKMASGDLGISYSKFPASIDIAKIIYKRDEKQEVELINRLKNPQGEIYPGDILISKMIDECHVSTGRYQRFIEALTELSFDLEKEFTYPLRIEFSNNLDNRDKLYLLQARSVAGIKNKKEFKMPELEQGKLITGTYQINGMGDLTLPAVVIIEKEGITCTDHIDDEEIMDLDQKYKEGYVLFSNFLKFDQKFINPLTPNKKAAVVCCDAIGGSRAEGHDWDIARQKNLLYFLIPDLSLRFYMEKEEKRRFIETGDIVRIVSDGVKGLVYEVEKQADSAR